MMSQWNDPPTTLTSFGPLSSEVSEGNNLIWRLLKRSKNGSRSSSREGSTERKANKPEKEFTAQISNKVEDDKSVDETAQPNQSSDQQTGNNTARTLNSVLNRLSSIVRTGTPQTYKDSDFKQYWMPDESCKECYDCGDKFTTFRRRHHCRICGQIFCSKCCNQELQGRIIGYKGGIRVCTYCGRVAMKALQSEPSGSISVDKEDLQLSLEAEPQVYSLWGSVKRQSQDLPRSASGITPGTPSIDVLIPFDPTQNVIDPDVNTGLGRKFLEDSVQLREIWRQIIDPNRGVEMQSHRIRLKTYYRCIVGNKLVDWLLSNDKAAQRMQAVVIGQALLDAGYLDVIGGQQNIFQDNFTLYKQSEVRKMTMTPVDPPDSTVTETDHITQTSTEPQWLQEIDVKTEQMDNVTEEHNTQMPETTSSTFYVPLPSTEDKDFEPLPRQDSAALGYTEDIISTSMFGGSQNISASKLIKSVCWRNMDNLKDDNGERKAYNLLKRVHQDHLNGLVQQMLYEEGLSKSWVDIVLGTAQRVSNYVRPDVRGEKDDMDILKYVKFKKIPGETKEKTWLVHGVVFTRNIAHKKMADKLVNPYILLLKGSIEYQRVENKFSSLEPQILQEEEFLKKNVKKISSLHPKPNIVIVEKSVSRLAQNYLLEKGITLIYNVKLSVMEKIERLTQGSMVPSIDGIVSGPITLGFCHNFKVCHFTLPSGENKTVLCFDGCAQHLGCTIVLRGGSRGELARIKKVMRQMITACYNSQLEISFCMDEFAMPESRADDTMTETDSMVNFSDMEKSKKTYIKVSDYLQDSRSEINLENLKNDNLLPEQNVDVVCAENETAENEKAIDKNSPVFMVGVDDHEKSEVLLPTDSENKILCSYNDEVQKPVLGLEGENIEAKNLMGQTDSVGSLITIIVEEPAKDNGDDPLKSDDLPKSKRISSELIPLNDQSDPLHVYQKNQDDAIFFSSVTLQEKTLKRFAKFRKILGELQLSMSPYIKFQVPYLDTEVGSASISRKFFPEDLYWSKYFEPVSYREKKQIDVEADTTYKPASPWSDIEIKEPHPFILTQLTGSLTDKNLQYMLAEYRARGGRISLKPRATGDKDKQEQRKTDNNNITDCLEYSNHQKFTVLLSSHSEKSTNYPNPCVPPQLVTMPFYSGLDITLGGFLEKFCFRESYCCQPYTCPSENCEVPLLDHVRRIVHEHGSIFISLRKLSNCVPGGDKDIMMWNWCRKCRQATPLAAMSNDTWSFSFAKFLELRFYVNTFTRRVGPEPCSHSLHHSFSQYFGHRNIVATFKYMPVIKKELVLPSRVINVETGIQLYQWIALRESMRSVEKRSMEMYNAIVEQLVSINSSNTELTKMIDDLSNILESEKHLLQELIHNGRLRTMEKEAENSESIADFFTLYDESLKMMRVLADADINWRSKMAELYSQVKKTKTTSQMKKDRESIPPVGELVPQTKKDYLGSSPSTRVSQKKNSNPVVEPVGPRDSSNVDSASDQLLPTVFTGKESPETVSQQGIQNKDEGNECNTVISKGLPENEFTGSLLTAASLEDEEVTRTWSGEIGNKSELPPSDPVQINIDDSYFMAESGIYSVTPGIAAGFGLGQTKPSGDNKLLPTDAEAAKYEIIDIDVNQPVADSNERSKQRSEIPKAESKTQLSGMELQNDKVELDKKAKGGKKLEDYIDGQQVERISGIMKKTITSFLSGTGFPPLPFPFDCREHHLLPTCYKVPVVVYDQEPSSIIAYALSSYDYHQKLQEIQAIFSSSQKFGGSTKDLKDDETGSKETAPPSGESKKTPGSILSFVKNKETNPKLTKLDSVRYNPKMDLASGETGDENDFSMLSTSLSESEKFKTGKQTQGPHIELQYSDHMAKFYCKIYFAEQFRKLRKLIFPAGEERFIRSLSRCKMWDAKGGKSGSKFCKTDDQRFILKQMSGAEIDVFEKFGPEYFTYMRKSYLEQKPTALGKIVGVYRIGYRNTHTNAGIRQDLLVMENLFYNRKISQTFDLKGSERNRLATTSGKRDEEQVLLDTNLLNLSIESPLYIYPHSKTLLMSVISSDSEFLSTNLVMDYSLLVGLDESNNELVLGIIDYIRTFTWDKKLETIIKSAGGKLPTVVSPEIYRSRFLAAMTRYFLPVPDQWTGKDFDPTLS